MAKFGYDYPKTLFNLISIHPNPDIHRPHSEDRDKVGNKTDQLNRSFKLRLPMGLVFRHVNSFHIWAVIVRRVILAYTVSLYCLDDFVAVDFPFSNV